MSESKRPSATRAEALRQRNEKASGEWISRVNRTLAETPQTATRFRLLRRKKSQNFSGLRSEDSEYTQARVLEKPLFKPGWRLLSFVVTALFSVAILSAWKMPEFQVRDIEVTGLSRIDPQNVRVLMDVIGKQIFLIKPDELEQSIAKAYPELMNIKVQVNVPAGVRISAIERQPYAAWKIGEHTLWIDTEGLLIPARGSAEVSVSIEADSLPPLAQQIRIVKYTLDKAVYNKPSIKPVVLSLAYFSAQKYIDDDFLKAILTLTIWLPDEKTFLYENVRGLGWNDSRGWKVFVGTDLRDLNQKMVLYESIVKELEKEKSIPVMVSVEYVTAPYYRME